ncbi:putative ribonuclease H-like domain-containing protein [Tanacetum coccineum]
MSSSKKKTLKHSQALETSIKITPIKDVSPMGDRIEVYVKKDWMFRFEPLLQDGICYLISNFGVTENGGRLPLLPHDWKLSFYKNTNVTRIDQIDDNFSGFKSEPFSRILDTNQAYKENNSVDVIGTVVGIGEIVAVNSIGSKKIRRTVIIEDEEGERIDLTFWDSWAKKWNEYADKLDSIGHIDVMLVLGKMFRLCIMLCLGQSSTLTNNSLNYLLSARGPTSGIRATKGTLHKIEHRSKPFIPPNQIIMSQPANDNFSLHDDEELSLHDDASLDGSVPASNKGDAPAKPPQIITTNTLSNIKLPVLQKDDYDTWAMEMEHYLEYIDNEVWKVIQNGNSKKRVTKGKDGVYRVLPPATQEEFADEKERKARTLLLMAVLKDHLRRFHGMDDAKEIWAAASRHDLVGYNDIPNKQIQNREQEDIDDSLYEYGKYGPQPQSPSPTVSDASSTHYSTCPSNDSDGVARSWTIVATSTTEAEYVAAANCCGQVLWVQNQLLDYGFNFMNTKIHIDNESTICIVKNPVYHSKTKHIEIRHHFIRDCYEKKLISVEKIHTDLNVADLLTKPFDGPRFNYLVVSIGFAEIVDFLRGSNLRYALTANPTIYDSLVKQFWQSAIANNALTNNPPIYDSPYQGKFGHTATARTLADGTQQLNATIDSIEYTITEESVRRQLQLADASGINMLQNEEIFAGLQNIGYLEEFEDSNDDDLATSDHEEAERSKRLAGKELSNPFIADDLLKIIWLSMYHGLTNLNIG